MPHGSSPGRSTERRSCRSLPARGGDRSDGSCAHRPRRHVRRHGVLLCRARFQLNADSRLRSLPSAARPVRPERARGSAPHPFGRRPGGLPQSRRAGLQGISRRLLLQAADRLGSARKAQRRLNRAFGMHVGPGGGAAPERRLCDRPSQRQDILRDFRRPVLHRSDAPRDARAGRDQRRSRADRARAGDSARCHERRSLPRAEGRLGA